VILSRTKIVFCAMFLLQMGYYLLVWRKRTIRRLT
jgi:hypothetical protein